MKDKLLAAWSLVYNRLGDPRTKNMLILILTLMTAFGMLAPDTATNLRNAVLSFAF
jgi:hypothetical protein